MQIAGMQDAKDTWYDVLRGRLSANNPDRTVVVRGVTRPGVLVLENELVSALMLADCFLLRWGKLACNTSGDRSTLSMTCEIAYATAGTAANGGMDRGRMLGRLDAELLAMVGAEPQNAETRDFTAADTNGAAVHSGTRIWWSEPEFSEAKAVGDRLQRTVSVTVMSFGKAGKL